eukprot:GHVQ01015685.1.p1 GENE.GHVQ01015685.1~~GHVQ01015685.1.p1  ORF type:complete len:847 (+),score=159.35 GHVQ01015685.1:120-2660(+)
MSCSSSSSRSSSLSRPLDPRFFSSQSSPLASRSAPVPHPQSVTRALVSSLSVTASMASHISQSVSSAGNDVPAKLSQKKQSSISGCLAQNPWMGLQVRISVLSAQRQRPQRPLPVAVAKRPRVCCCCIDRSGRAPLRKTHMGGGWRDGGNRTGGLSETSINRSHGCGVHCKSGCCGYRCSSAAVVGSSCCTLRTCSRTCIQHDSSHNDVSVGPVKGPPSPIPWRSRGPSPSKRRNPASPFVTNSTLPSPVPSVTAPSQCSPTRAVSSSPAIGSVVGSSAAASSCSSRESVYIIPPFICSLCPSFCSTSSDTIHKSIPSTSSSSVTHDSCNNTTSQQSPSSDTHVDSISCKVDQPQPRTYEPSVLASSQITADEGNTTQGCSGTCTITNIPSSVGVVSSQQTSSSPPYSNSSACHPLACSSPSMDGVVGVKDEGRVDRRSWLHGDCSDYNCIMSNSHTTPSIDDSENQLTYNSYACLLADRERDAIAASGGSTVREEEEWLLENAERAHGVQSGRVTSKRGRSGQGKEKICVGGEGGGGRGGKRKRDYLGSMDWKVKEEITGVEKRRTGSLYSDMSSSGMVTWSFSDDDGKGEDEVDHGGGEQVINGRRKGRGTGDGWCGGSSVGRYEFYPLKLSGHGSSRTSHELANGEDEECFVGMNSTGGFHDPQHGHVTGVWYDSRRKLWRALYKENGKRKTKGFSSKEFGGGESGFLQAKRMAIELKCQKALESRFIGEGRDTIYCGVMDERGGVERGGGTSVTYDKVMVGLSDLPTPVVSIAREDDELLDSKLGNRDGASNDTAEGIGVEGVEGAHTTAPSTPPEEISSCIPAMIDRFPDVTILPVNIIAA